MVGHIPAPLDLVEVIALLTKEVGAHQDVGGVGMLPHRKDGIVLTEE